MDFFKVAEAWGAKVTQAEDVFTNSNVYWVYNEDFRYLFYVLNSNGWWGPRAAIIKHLQQHYPQNSYLVLNNGNREAVLLLPEQLSGLKIDDDGNINITANMPLARQHTVKFSNLDSFFDSLFPIRQDSDNRT